MKKIVQRISILLTALTVLSFSVAPVATVGAQTRDEVCAGVRAAGGSCNDAGTGSRVNDIIGLVVNVLSTLVGIVAVIMIILGGYKYITSSGDTSNVQSAKNTILFAIVGLIIVAMAQVITGFVLEKAS